MLELYDMIFMIAVLGVGSGVFTYAIKRHNPAKTAARAGYEGIKTIYETYNTQVQDVLKIKDAQIKRLNAKLQVYEAPIEEEKPSKEPINLDSLAPMLQERGLNPDILKNPLVLKYIKKYTKGMGIEEIIAIADQLGIFKGKSKGLPAQTGQSTFNPDWA